MGAGIAAAMAAAMGTKTEKELGGVKSAKGVVTGSSFLEVDTGDVFLFDEESEAWLKVGGDNA